MGLKIVGTTSLNFICSMDNLLGGDQPLDVTCFVGYKV